MNNFNLNYQELSPFSIEQLLSGHGWEHLKTFPGKSSVWRSPTKITKWVPQDTSVEDYEEAIDAIIEAFAQSKSISPEDAASYFRQLYLNKDLVRLRVDSSDVQNGQIGLTDGTELFKSLKRIISNTLEGVPGLAKNVKDQFLNRSELAQTQVGSYVINAYLPLLEDLDINQREFQNLPSPAVGRKVNERLAQRLSVLQEVLANYSDLKSAALIERLLLAGFTRVECEAIEALFGKKGHRNWEIDFLWSSTLGEVPSIKSHIRFEHGTSSSAHQVTKRFSRLNTQPDSSLVGRVTKLNRDYADKQGHISLRTHMDDKEITVHVSLDETRYQIAQEANANKQVVRITGDLITYRTGSRKRYVMRSVTALTVIQKELF